MIRLGRGGLEGGLEEEGWIVTVLHERCSEGHPLYEKKDSERINNNRPF